MGSYTISKCKFEYYFKENQEPLSITKTFLTFINKYDLALTEFIKKGNIKEVFSKYYIKPEIGKTLFKNYRHNKIIHIK